MRNLWACRVHLTQNSLFNLWRSTISFSQPRARGGSANATAAGYFDVYCFMNFPEARKRPDGIRGSNWLVISCFYDKRNASFDRTRRTNLISILKTWSNSRHQLYDLFFHTVDIENLKFQIACVQYWKHHQSFVNTRRKHPRLPLTFIFRIGAEN